MRRGLLATLLLLHGLSHANIGVWAFAEGPTWLVVVLWAAAMLGYFAAGFGLLGVRGLRLRWKQTLTVATLASIALLVMFGHGIALLGIYIDLIVLVIVLEIEQRIVDRELVLAATSANKGFRHPWSRRLATGMSVFMLGYCAAVVAFRPVYVRWGTSAADRSLRLPGDERAPDARYRVDHAITIHAPASAVWPWLVQLGQDRAGFYSYDWLERAFGDDIRNADRIHPEWQTIARGDLVRATQPSYLGGKFGDLGWKVTDVVPGRALILENWGAFVVEPVDSTTSRLIVRTRGPGNPSFLGLVFGPLNVFVFEPAHFIMQRGMLRGIRDRAEQLARGQEVAVAR
jgi:hypothetical protein